MLGRWCPANGSRARSARAETPFLQRPGGARSKSKKQPSRISASLSAGDTRYSPESQFGPACPEMPRRSRRGGASLSVGRRAMRLLPGEKPQQRNAANARERARMRVLSKAFCRLKTTLPWVPPDTKLSKLDTLRLATSYIAHLRHLTGADDAHEMLDAVAGAADHPHPTTLVSMQFIFLGQIMRKAI